MDYQETIEYLEDSASNSVSIAKAHHENSTERDWWLDEAAHDLYEANVYRRLQRNQ